MGTSRIGSIVLTAVAACAAQSPSDADAPLAVTADALAVEMNAQATIGVLDNDRGVEDGRSLELATQPAHGTASLGEDGVLQFQPAADFLGDDGIDYRVINPNGEIATGHVSISVGCATCAIGVDVTLRWNANAPGDMVQGYRMYYGPTDDTSTMAMVDDIEVSGPNFDPDMPAITFDAWADLHLRIGETACFSLTAYNSAGESSFSNVVCKTVTTTAMNFGL